MTSARAVPLPAVDELTIHSRAELTATKVITADDPYLSGHYPGRPIYPGVFSLETVCQAVESMVRRRYAPGTTAELQQLESLRLLGVLGPGDRAEARITCTEWADGQLRVAATVSANGTAAVRVTALVTVTPPPEAGR